MKSIKENQYKNVPEEMKDLPRWIKWKKVAKKNKHGNTKWTKIPYSIKDNSSFNWNNPNKWESYNTAKKYTDEFDGLGYVLVEKDNIVAIDLDNCIENRKLNSFAKKIIEIFSGTYMELSQSEKGIHIFLKGSISKNLNLQNLGIEMYKDNRYIALTGDLGADKYFEPSNILLNKDKEIKDLYNYCIEEDRKRFKKKHEINTERIIEKSLSKELNSTVNISSLNKVPDVNTILDTMDRTNPIASNLIEGNSYTGDPSRDDFIFLLLAKNYSHGNPSLMEELFLKTSLNRLGTGQKRKSDTKYIEYLHKTIDKVLGLNGYRPFDWTSHNEYKQRIKSYEAR
ncbi:MAG: hypothetical protein ACTHWZ_01775 [Peptoniphilaceae bacterium]